MEYNKDFTGEKYRDIADAFGVEDAYTGDLRRCVRGRAGRTQAHRGSEEPDHDLRGRCHRGRSGSAVDDAFNDVCTPGNSRQATEEDILKIYTSLM